MKKIVFVAFVLLCGVSFGFGGVGSYDRPTQAVIDNCEEECSQQEFKCEVGPGLKSCESQKKGFMDICMRKCTSVGTFK